MKIYTDFNGKTIRLTQERFNHIIEHPEMIDLTDKISDILEAPDLVIQSLIDNEVEIFTKFYITKTFKGKFICVVVKYLRDDAFIITSYITNKIPKGDIIWQKN